MEWESVMKKFKLTNESFKTNLKTYQTIDGNMESYYSYYDEDDERVCIFVFA